MAVVLEGIKDSSKQCPSDETFLDKELGVDRSGCRAQSKVVRGDHNGLDLPCHLHPFHEATSGQLTLYSKEILARKLAGLGTRGMG